LDSANDVRLRLGLDLQRTSEGLAGGGCCSASWAHVTLRSTSALLGPGTQSSRSISTFLLVAPLRGETCRFTLPIWMLAEGRDTYIHYTRW